MTTITREQAQKIIEAADEVISALSGTNEDVHPGSDNMLRLWDDLNDRYAPPEVVRELARIVLASLEAEPVAYIFKHPAGKLFWALTDESNKEQPDVIPVYADSPAPVVPDEIDVNDVPRAVTYFKTHRDCYADGWNACRAAMLQGVEQPQNARQNIPENIPDGNSPAIPDDWVMVPKEPTQAMIKAWLSEVANFRGHAAGYKAALAAAPQREVK
ncbi:hypothetical protein ABGO49_002529 [Salmonella enterica subsp. enterica serovar Bareilly]|nr:hypothetical protein [Salmonella enterica]EBS4926316.1 hypothetical protein [Salmonella enterica subsp. enterica serovar Bareilly]EBY8432161.1 hypothetical protein [Salmonella enterica subsp. enterica serovar Virchow]EBJ0944796.1 hypothetical protein [Salmonella enterica]EBO3632832.1 hypothetical protein [Salmonella enterica]